MFIYSDNLTLLLDFQGLQMVFKVLLSQDHQQILLCNSVVHHFNSSQEIISFTTNLSITLLVHDSFMTYFLCNFFRSLYKMCKFSHESFLQHNIPCPSLNVMTLTKDKLPWLCPVCMADVIMNTVHFVHTLIIPYYRKRAH